MPSWEDADEDVNNLDDQELIEACLGLGSGDAPKRGMARHAHWDWPPEAGKALSVEIDGDVTAWFQTQSVAWRKLINAVLRGWIEAQGKEEIRPTDG